jgi:hypothetical protein
MIDGEIYDGGFCCAAVSMQNFVFDNTKGDNVTSIGPAKIRGGKLNPVSACLYKKRLYILDNRRTAKFALS